MKDMDKRLKNRGVGHVGRRVGYKRADYFQKETVEKTRMNDSQRETPLKCQDLSR